MSKEDYLEKGNVYLFHQTPPKLALDLMQFIPLVKDDVVYEPFAGEDAFYNAFPHYVHKDWSEITRGRDYIDYKESYDWVITNPPFKLPNDQGVSKNAIFNLLLYFAERASKGIAFFVSTNGLNSLTPYRIAKMNALGFYIQSLTVCAVKEWRGRYYFIIWIKQPSSFFNCLLPTYSNKIELK